MIVMTSNDASQVFHDMFARHPKNIGWIMSPGNFKEPPDGVPFALDNGAFGAFKNGTAWDEGLFFEFLDRFKHLGITPRWVVIPDCVGDKSATRKMWDKYAILVRRYGWPMAFAVQDGMTAADVPMFVDVVFVGGNTRWKWLTARRWCLDFPRVHIARVNTRRQLLYCKHIGAESTDGTGWFRGGPKRIAGLFRFLREET